MGVLELGDSNLDLLMSQDEEIAEELDRERFAAEEGARVAEVAEAIGKGSGREGGCLRALSAQALRQPCRTETAS